MKMRNYVSKENTIRFITEFRKEFSSPVSDRAAAEMLYGDSAEGGLGCL